MRQRLLQCCTVLLVTAGLLLACHGKLTSAQAESILKGLPAGTYAVMQTNAGDIVIHLEVEKAPRTSANFIGLAEGVRPWIEIKTLTQVKRPFYDGLVFHRVVWDFAVQGGDPIGLGTGGPGYTFPLELTPELNFDKPYMIAMAGSDPGINSGSQFFFTVSPQPGLNGGFGPFGEVVKGQDVVLQIDHEPVYQTQRPVRDQVILAVRIYRVEANGTIVASPPPADIDIGADMPAILKAAINETNH